MSKEVVCRCEAGRAHWEELNTLAVRAKYVITIFSFAPFHVPKENVMELKATRVCDRSCAISLMYCIIQNIIKGIPFPRMPQWRVDCPLQTFVLKMITLNALLLGIR